MKNTLETRLGMFVALAIVAGVLLIELLGGTDIFRRGRHLYARFNTVQDLKVGDRVKMAGVDIGRVDDIQLDRTNNRVKVALKLKGDVEVRSDSLATIKFAGLMGQNYVSVDFGARGFPLADGQYITTAETPDFSVIMAKLENVATGVENLTKSWSGESIDNILGPLIGMIKDVRTPLTTAISNMSVFVADNRVPLTLTVSNINRVTAQIASGEGTVGKLINETELYDSAMLTITNLQDAVADARGILAEANSGRGTIGKLLVDDALYRETTNGMTNLREILQKINQGQGSVGKLVNDEDLYKNAKLTLQKLDKATEGLEDQGPLSVMGILVNNLF
jgi:phospholipid/cholesterol/gamma-HCH transport system substrate-binding protein